MKKQCCLCLQFNKATGIQCAWQPVTNPKQKVKQLAISCAISPWDVTQVTSNSPFLTTHTPYVTALTSWLQQPRRLTQLFRQIKPIGHWLVDILSWRCDLSWASYCFIHLVKPQWRIKYNQSSRFLLFRLPIKFLIASTLALLIRAEILKEVQVYK